MLSVLLVDDHGVVLHGLEALLATEEGIQVLGTCVNAREALQSIPQLRPDVLVLDFHLPDLTGLEVLSALSARGLLPTTLMLTATAEEWQVREALARGAWGVVVKDRAPSVIVDCIYAAHEGLEWDPELAPYARRQGTSTLDFLTAREREIAVRVARGQSNKAIAKDLGVAEGTVKAHLHRIFRKLDVASRVELTLQVGRTPADGGPPSIRDPG